MLLKQTNVTIKRERGEGRKEESKKETARCVSSQLPMWDKDLNVIPSLQIL
jgi:hypothetical protein